MNSRIEKIPPAMVAIGLVNRFTTAIRNSVNVINPKPERNFHADES